MIATQFSQKQLRNNTYDVLFIDKKRRNYNYRII